MKGAQITIMKVSKGSGMTLFATYLTYEIKKLVLIHRITNILKAKVG